MIESAREKTRDKNGKELVVRRCSRLIIKGTVQGVLYRKFVKEHAQKLGIEGTVQNSSDGSVVIDACGIIESLETFIDFLYQGPPKSKVELILEEPLRKYKEFRGVFRIIAN